MVMRSRSVHRLPWVRKLLLLPALALSVMVVATVGAPGASGATLDVTFAGAGTGTVTSNPAGINCSNVPGSANTECSHDFGVFFGSATLTAKPEPGWAFLSWSGSVGGTCAGSKNPCDTTTLLIGAFTATATFAPSPDRPSVITGEASEVAFPTARLSGEVIPNSDAFPVIDCRFEYGPTTAYGKWVSCAQVLGTGTSPVGVSAIAGALEPGTTYHYRLTVSNAGGTTYGADRTLIAAAAPVDDCPNAAVRAQQGAQGMSLPDCRAYEQVSPERVSGQRVSMKTPTDDGNSGVIRSAGGFADTQNLPDLGVEYATQRTSTGWASSAIAPPAAQFPYIGTWGSLDQTPDGWRSLWLVNLKQDEGTNNWTPVVRDPEGSFHVAGVTVKGEASPKETVAGTSADLGTIVQATRTRPPLTDGTVDTRNANRASLYVSTRNVDGSLSTRQVAYKDGAIMFPATCQVDLGSNTTVRGAISADGKKIFFSVGGLASCRRPESQRVWAKVGDADPIDLSKTQCDDGDCGAEAVALYKGAARDGSRVYFTTVQKLVNGDQNPLGKTDQNDLYEYDFNATGDKLRSVTASLDAAGAGVVEITRISEDGTHAYFVANGRPLAGKNARGKTPVSGDQNLYVYHREPGQAKGNITFIGALDPGADSVQWTSERPAKTSSNGRFLLFLSAANLTGEKLPGDSYRDLYRYDAQNDELRRIWTTDPAHNGTARSGEPYMQPVFELPGAGGAMQFMFNSNRMMSDDGRTIGFATTEPLSPRDANQVNDVYLWRASTGRFTMLTDGRADAVTGGLNASSVTAYGTMTPSGDSVFFASYVPLLASHTSGQSALFVARRNGGFLLPEAPPAPCVGEACQGSVAPPPVLGSPLTETFSGIGNVPAPKAPEQSKQQTKLRVGPVKTVRGTSTRLRVTVPGKGEIRVSGSGMKRAIKDTSKAGTHRVTVRLSRRAQRTLQHKHRVRIRVSIRFTPAKGKASTARRSVTFKRKKASRRSAEASTRAERRAAALSTTARKGR